MELVQACLCSIKDRESGFHQIECRGAVNFVQVWLSDKND